MPYNDSKGPKMESAKQERKDLLRDNPVVRDMDSSRPWMSKHFQSTMGSALKAGHESGESPMSKHDGKSFDDPGFMDTHFKSGKPRNEAPEMKMDGMSMKYGGPEMSALHENHVETGKEQEDETPQPPQRMGRIVRKMEKKPANFDQLSAEEKAKIMKEMREKAKQ